MSSKEANRAAGTYHLGVDLGTTYVAAGILRQGRPEIVTLGDRAPVVPSVLYFKDDGEVLHGESATRRGLSDPTRVVREFKRRVGDATPMVVGQTPYSADVLLAKLLRFAHEAVVERQGGAPASIAITHPANWGSYKIDVLQQAVRMADVGSVTTLTEPVAAAIHYATTERLDQGQTVAVYDLGGGTFDAAVLRRTSAGVDGAGFEVLGDVEGIERLGGIDFDEAVFHHAIRWCESAVTELDPDDPNVIQALARLRQECVEAKEALSTDTDVSIPVVLPNLQTEVRLTRSEFEAMIRPLLQQTVDALQRAIRSSGVEVDDLAAVLLVGGSSRVPLISEMVGAELGRPIAVDQHPKHTVALGAAIAAGRAAGADVPGPARQGAEAPTAAPTAGLASSASPSPGADADLEPVGPPDDRGVDPAGSLRSGRGRSAGSGQGRRVAPAAGVVAAHESQLVPVTKGEGDGPKAVVARSNTAAHSESPSPVVITPMSEPVNRTAAPRPDQPRTATAPSARVAASPAPPSRSSSGGPRPFDHREVLAGSVPPGGSRGRGRLTLAVVVAVLLALLGGAAWAMTRAASDGEETVTSGDAAPAAVDPAGPSPEALSDEESSVSDGPEAPSSTALDQAGEDPSASAGPPPSTQAGQGQPTTTAAGRTTTTRASSTTEEATTASTETVVDVPDVIGLSRARAKAELTSDEYDFTVRFVEQPLDPGDPRIGKVIATNPASRSQVRRGSPIRVSIGVEVEPTTTSASVTTWVTTTDESTTTPTTGSTTTTEASTTTEAEQAPPAPPTTQEDGGDAGNPSG